MEFCPNCDRPIKNGLIGQNKIVDQDYTDQLNKLLGAECEAYCQKCYYSLITYAYEDRQAQESQKEADKQSAFDSIKAILPSMPIVSIHNPHRWNYDVIGLVSAQSVTGTGLFSEITSGVTDIFGLQSGTYVEKIAKGEEICRQMLRFRAAEKGGNAILAADIDYAEVGGTKGMLMVCMSGTAVKINNLDVLPPEAVDDLRQIAAIVTRIIA